MKLAPSIFIQIVGFLFANFIHCGDIVNFELLLPINARPGFVLLDLGLRYGQAISKSGKSPLADHFRFDSTGTKLILSQILTDFSLISPIHLDLVLKTPLIDGTFVERVQSVNIHLITVDQQLNFLSKNYRSKFTLSSDMDNHQSKFFQLTRPSYFTLLAANVRQSIIGIEYEICTDFDTTPLVQVVKLIDNEIGSNTYFYSKLNLDPTIIDKKYKKDFWLVARSIPPQFAAETEIKSTEISRLIDQNLNDHADQSKISCKNTFIILQSDIALGISFFDVRTTCHHNLNFDLDQHKNLIYRLEPYFKIPFEIDPFTGQLFVIDYLKSIDNFRFDIVAFKACGFKNQKSIEILRCHMEISVENLGKGAKNQSITENMQINENFSCLNQSTRFKRAIKPDFALNVPENFRPGKFLRQKIPLTNEEQIKDAPLKRKFFTVFQNGSIFLTDRLNYEAEPNIQWTVLIQNMKTSQETPQRILISVRDVDEKPKFVNRPTPFLAVVPQEVPVGFTVYKFQARDEEGDGDEEIEYKLISTDPPDSFSIDSKSGRVKATLTRYEPGRSYAVYVQSHDRTWQNATSRVSDVAKLDVKVGSRPPQFFQEIYQFSVSENTPVMASVAQVKAMSFLNNPEQPIKFSLLEENSNKNFNDPQIENNRENSKISAFSMNEQTGVVHLAKNLDFDDMHEPRLYKLTAVAHEAGQKSTVPLEIEVTDINDNDPVFTQPLYTATINEDHPIGEKILQVSARDKDSGKNADLTYSVDNKNFTIDKNGLISPLQKLDADQKQLGIFIYRFLVTAIDNGSPPRSATSQVHVKTLNVNDEAPVFVPTNLYTDYVAEDAQGNTPILYVQAQDSDRDQVKYAFLDDNNHHVTTLRHFDIDKDTGLIKLREGVKPSNLHEQDSYEFDVIAMDDSSCCTPRTSVVHTSKAKVRVGVKDINNNKPVFRDCESYSRIAKVPEGKHKNLLIIKVEATDDDSGQNGDIVYTLYYPGGDNRRPFNINATSGDLWASPFVEFDREERPFEDVTVKATDKGARPLIGFCHFTVTVEDENDNSPEFNRATYEATISRSTPVGQSVLTVFADDRDGPNNSKITYSLRSDQNEPDHEHDTSYFKINDKGGEIILTNYVPANRQKMIFLAVASDNGHVTKSGQSKVVIDVAEAAQHYPVWQEFSKCPSEVVVDEDVQINNIFFECYAVSGTSKTNSIAYSMRNGQKPNANSNGDFREFQTKRNGNDWVVIRNLKPLDYEKINSYELTISAKDMRNGLSKDKTLLVKVRDKNDNVPKFSSDQFTGQIVEEKEVVPFSDQPILIVVAKDNDQRAEFRDITYSILPGPASLLFRIDPKTGAVHPLQSFDREKNDSFILDIQAEDGAPSDLPGSTGPNRDLTKVQIIVQDINDNAPFFAEPLYKGRVRENVEIQQNVMTVKAHDLDKNSELRYSLDQRGNENNSFAVYPNSGTIFVSSQLDYETKKKYNLTLYVTDGTQSHQASTRIEIEIEDVNDNAPQFEKNQYLAQFREEDKNVPKKLLQVRATDKDEGSASRQIVYKLVGQGANKEFTINSGTGEIFSSEPLDRDPPNGIDRWNFVVQAIDDNGHGLVGYADVQVLLDDVNDNSPIFENGPFVGFITENQDITDAAGVYVCTVTAVDHDDPRTPNAKLTYDIQRNKYFGDRPVFRIESQTGKVFALMKLDRENVSQREFEIQIKATDQGTPPLSGVGTVLIKVTDVNDNAPYFEPVEMSGSVKESAQLHSPVMFLSAKDPDNEAKDNVLQYSIFNNGEDWAANFFYVTTDPDNSGSNVGIVRVKQPLDYEDQRQRHGFNFSVQVTDGRYAAVGRVHVRLLDQNDNPPRFDVHPSRLRIAEDAHVGQAVHKFSASDPDFDGHDQFSYKIQHDSDIHRQFDIGQEDGVLRVIKPLDREKIGEYRLVIEAKDSAGNSGNTSAIIVVTDINDNAPDLQYDVGNFVVNENVKYATPKLLGHVTGVDPDLPGNGSPYFFDHQSNSSSFNLFKIQYDPNWDNNNGGAAVYAIGPFDREGPLGKTIFIELAVKDSGKPAMEAIRFLPVVVADSNDSPMRDGASTIYVFNYNGMMPTTVIGRVYVEDLDDWDVTDKIFTLKGGPLGSEENFMVNRHGLISMTSKTPADTYTLEVNVKDTKRHEAAHAKVTIVVEYVNSQSIDSAASIRIQGLTPEDFLRSPRQPMDSTSPYETFRTKLADLADVPPRKVQIFSVQQAVDPKISSPRPGDQLLDVHFAVLRNSPFKRPALLHGLMVANKALLEKSLGAKISKISVDPCLAETCATGACIRRLTVDPEPMVVMSNRSSLVGLKLEIGRQCTTPHIHLPLKCTSSACLNNGICHNVKGHNGTAGFFCECRVAGRGSRCEGRTRGFETGGYAWLKPVGSGNNFSISFEFITRSKNALLLYNGPMVEKEQPDDQSSQDLLAVQILNGQLTVHVDLGSGLTMLQLNNTKAPMVNDGIWHTVDIFMQPGARVLTVMLDRCQNITASSRLSFNVSPQCKASAPTYGPNEQLNVDTPLQLGGVAKVNGRTAPFLRTAQSLEGCIRNLKIDGQLYDMLDVLKSEYSTPGCSHTSTFCETVADDATQGYCHQGECVASFNGQKHCSCDPGFFGERCEMETKWKMFKKNALVRYHFTEPLPHSWTKAKLLFVRNDDRLDDGQLMRAENGQRSKSSVINLVSRRVGFEFSADRGEQFEVRPPLNLQPHVAYGVEVEQFWHYASVSVDGLFDQAHAARRLPAAASLQLAGDMGEESLVDFDQHGVYLGGYGAPMVGTAAWAGRSSAHEEFQGCIRDFVFDDMPLVVAGDNFFAKAVDVREVVDGCPLLVHCSSVQCAPTMVCVDTWKGAVCSCPSGSAPIWHPANDGTLSACTEGVAALRVGITNRAVAVILISLMALLLLVLILVIYSRRRRKPPSIQEDLISRENVRGYNEEGGGEEDQDNYNIGPLRKPVLPSDDWPQATPILANSQRKPKSSVPLDGNLDSFIRDRLRDADGDPMAPPFDELRTYAVEGGADVADQLSLSSLSSDGESDVEPERRLRNDWGPKFQNLREIYTGR